MPLAGRRVGILVGYDLLFPEAARVLRLAGCDLILVAGALGAGADAANVLLPARALENRCVVAFASADPLLAPAAVIGPDGRQIGGPTGGEGGRGLVLADLPPGAGPAAGAGALAERRPRLYARLAQVEARGAAPRE
jgi:predicted amidohydrolase